MSYRQTFRLRGVETKCQERKLVTLASCGHMLMQNIRNLVCWCSITSLKQTSTYSSLVYFKTQLLWQIGRHFWPEGGQQNYNGDWYYSFEHGADIKFYSTSSTNSTNICTWLGAWGPPQHHRAGHYSNTLPRMSQSAQTQASLGGGERRCQVWSTLGWQSSSAVKKNEKRDSLEHFGSRF